eukprot:TRINITY_DN9636_c0_g1_i2.p2 TRINITY_DN9636_c0_g1~~TRINITY_DN9636_c0_g1_i2.p2  ORF type:complete len:120 (+),score=4.56 TRINITY_DN9636_c0_g1_i2:196-555(+)
MLFTIIILVLTYFINSNRLLNFLPFLKLERSCVELYVAIQYLVQFISIRFGWLLIKVNIAHLTLTVNLLDRLQYLEGVEEVRSLVDYEKHLLQEWQQALSSSFDFIYLIELYIVSLYLF